MQVVASLYSTTQQFLKIWRVPPWTLLCWNGSVPKLYDCLGGFTILIVRHSEESAKSIKPHCGSLRLTRIQKFMEQDQMQNIAMIPAKEAKMFTYKLLEHNFLQIKELKKGTSNFAPVKSFILFHVDLPQVCITSATQYSPNDKPVLLSRLPVQR